MKYERLGDIALEIKNGKTPPTTNPEYFGDEINWYTPGDLDKQMYLTKSQRGITKKALIDKKAIIYKPETVLIGCVGDIGKIGITTELSSSNQQITGLLPNPAKVTSEYLYYWLKSNKNLLFNTSKSAIVPILNNKNLTSIRIAYPELSTQIHIANILTKAENLITQRKESIRLLDEYLKSTFLEMFGDPVVGKRFTRKTFKEISTVRQGLQIPISERRTEPGMNRFAYITNQFLNGGKIAEFIENPRPNVICRKDDILMTRTGNTGIVLSDVEGVFHNNFFLIDYDRNNINKLYLVHFLRQPQVKALVLKKASTTTIPDLNHGDFYKITLPIPPLDIQTQFAQIVEKTDAIKVQYRQSLQELENLYGSLSQRAFRGELNIKEN